MSEFKKKLRAVFDKGAVIGTPYNDGNTRFVPRSLNGGTGWQVYDTREDRFLSDREIKDIPLDQLVSEPRVTS